MCSSWFGEVNLKRAFWRPLRPFAVSAMKGWRLLCQFAMSNLFAVRYHNGFLRALQSAIFAWTDFTYARKFCKNLRRWLTELQGKKVFAWGLFGKEVNLVDLSDLGAVRMGRGVEFAKEGRGREDLVESDTFEAQFVFLTAQQLGVSGLFRFRRDNLTFRLLFRLDASNITVYLSAAWYWLSSAQI